MQYIVKNRTGKSVYSTTDEGYAKHYAKHIGGSVVSEKNSLKRNPPFVFGDQPGTVSDRKNMFGQYKTSPSYVWARETIQNAVDNKATDIKYSVTEINSGPYAGSVLARIVDNGTGMDIKTLKEKFLTIGGTGKGERTEDTGSIGGFGEAKKVVLLAWRAWRVITKTRDGKAILADSVNGWKPCEIDYIDAPLDIETSGTIVEVLSWPDFKHRIDTSDARNFISYCDLPNVTFNIFDFRCDKGSLLEGKFAYDKERESCYWQAEKRSLGRTEMIGEWLYCTDALKNKIANFSLGNAKATFRAPVVVNENGDTIEKDCAKLYFKRFTREEAKYQTPRVFYRVKGLFLWQSGLVRQVKGNAIIEFTIKTTLVLSDNRDSISNPILDASIQQWILELVRDPALKLRGYSKDRTFVFAGSGDSLQAPIKPKAIAAAQEIAAIQMSGTGYAKSKKIDEVAEKVAENIIQ